MNDQLIQNIISICTKRPIERSHADIELLVDLTKHCKIFKNIIEENGIASHIICCKYLHHHFQEQNSFVFRYGEKGTRFYIIIHGKVAVEVLRKNPKGEDVFEEVVELQNGSAFGELALESDKPRAASIRCKQDSHFLYLEKVDYVALIAKLIQRKRENNVNFLQKLPALACCTRGTLTKLTYAFSEKVFNKGQIVYVEGQEAKEIFLIKKGEFEFFKQISPEEHSISILKKFKFKQKNCKIASYGVGEMFGEEDTLQNINRSNSCKCIEDKSVLMIIDKDDFYKQLKQHPDLIDFVFQRVKVKTQDFDKRAKMRRLVESLPRYERKKTKKTSICEDLEKDISLKCRVYYSVSSEASLAASRKSSSVDGKIKDIASNRKSCGSDMPLLKSNFIKCKNIIEKLARSEKFLPRPKIRRDYKELTGLTITAMSQINSTISKFKPFRTHQA